MYSSAAHQIPVQLVVADPALVTRLAASVCAGFPSPAEDLGASRIDLNAVLIKHPLATFMMGVAGPSMREAGIDDDGGGKFLRARM